jgi:S-adenosylmethionine synthetase
MCSRIGHPIDQPVLVSAAVKTAPGVHIQDLHGQVSEMIAAELAGIDTFLVQLREGRFTVY